MYSLGEFAEKKSELACELNDVIKKLQACKVALALATEHVQFESDEYAQLLLWCSDIEFIEALIGMWMDENKIEREERLFTRHIQRKSHRVVYKIDHKLLDEKWIGGTHGKASH